jgi:hypothetical protein
MITRRDPLQGAATAALHSVIGDHLAESADLTVKLAAMRDSEDARLFRAALVVEAMRAASIGDRRWRDQAVRWLRAVRVKPSREEVV